MILREKTRCWSAASSFFFFYQPLLKKKMQARKSVSKKKKTILLEKETKSWNAERRRESSRKVPSYTPPSNRGGERDSLVAFGYKKYIDKNGKTAIIRS